MSIDYSCLCQNNDQYDYSDYTYRNGIIEDTWDILNRLKIKKLKIRDSHGNFGMINNPLSSAEHLEQLEFDIVTDESIAPIQI